MKTTAFGYAKNRDEETPLHLSEVSFVSPPAELRRIAAFLVKAAKEMEQHGAGFGHSHLRDEVDLKPWADEALDVIVARPS
jgi:hypothetical protein